MQHHPPLHLSVLTELRVQTPARASPLSIWCYACRKRVAHTESHLALLGKPPSSSRKADMTVQTPAKASAFQFGTTQTRKELHTQNLTWLLVSLKVLAGKKTRTCNILLHLTWKKLHTQNLTWILVRLQVLAGGTATRTCNILLHLTGKELHTQNLTWLLVRLKSSSRKENNKNLQHPPPPHRKRAAHTKSHLTLGKAPSSSSSRKESNKNLQHPYPSPPSPPPLPSHWPDSPTPAEVSARSQPPAARPASGACNARCPGPRCSPLPAAWLWRTGGRTQHTPRTARRPGPTGWGQCRVGHADTPRIFRQPRCPYRHCKIGKEIWWV